MLHLLLENRLLRAAQLVHEHPAPRRGHQHLGCARLAVTVGILARMVHVETVMRMLDQRNAQSALHKQRQQLFDEGGLAAAGPAGKSKGLHAVAPPQELPAPAVQPRQWSPNCMERFSTRSKSKSKMLSGLPPAPAARSSSIWLKSQS